jgi:hypothetical protein
MGNSYTFTTGGNIQSGSIIRSEDFTTEYTALQSAFDGTGGHSHDGTAGEGGPITKLGPGANILTIASTAIELGTGASAGSVSLGTTSKEWGDIYLADNKNIFFGDDQDVKITHIPDTGLRLLTANVIQFRDADLNIGSSANGQLDINADTELQITAPTVDINASTAVLISNDLKLDSDSAVLGFGADNDTTLTHTDGTGLTLNGTNKLTFGDVASFIQQSGDGVLTIDGEVTIDLNASSLVDVSNALTAGGIIKTEDTTEATSTTDGSLQTDGGLSVVKDAVLGNDVKLKSDSAVLSFGADDDITVTHVADIGLTLNGTLTTANSILINGTTPTLTIGDGGAEDTKVVFDGNAQDFYVGLDDSADDLVIGKGSTVGTTPAISIDENLNVTVHATTANTTTSDGALIVGGGLGVGADATFGDDVRLKTDGAIINFGADDDVNLTHVADTGLLLNSTRELQFGSSSTKIHQSSSGVLDVTATTVRVSNDLHLNTDASVLGFGADNDITITHVADTGLTVTSANTDANAGPVLVLDRNNNNASNNDIIGSVQFKGDNASNNSVIMGEIKTKITDTTAGNEDSDVIISNIVEGNLTPQLTISATGVTAHVGFTHSGDLTVGDDLLLNSDSALISLGADADATITHDGTTGVTIAANPITLDSGGDVTLDANSGIFIFKDAGSEVLRVTEGNSGDVTVKLATDAKDLVFTDNGDAVNMKILDAAAGINVPGEVQTTKIAFTDGDDAMTVADGGDVTFANDVTITNDVNVTGRATPGTPSAASATSGTVTFDLAVNNNFTLTASGAITSLGFANQDASSVGQSGTIKLVLGSAYAITPAATIAINADTLSAIQAAGTYMLTYFVTAASGNDSIMISSSGVLT